MRNKTWRVFLIILFFPYVLIYWLIKALYRLLSNHNRLNHDKTEKHSNDKYPEVYDCRLKDADVQWSRLNQRKLEAMRTRDIDLYRNTVYQMAEHLRKERRYAQALEFYLTVVNLDLQDTQPFLAPKVIYWINRMAKLEKLTLEDIQHIHTFGRMVEGSTHKRNAQWRRIKEGLEAYKVDRQILRRYDFTNIEPLLNQIQNNKDDKNRRKTLQNILKKFTRFYTKQNKITKNDFVKIKQVLEALLYSTNEINKSYGEQVLLDFAKKDKQQFADIVIKYVNSLEERYWEKSTLFGILGKIELSWVEKFIPEMIKSLTRKVKDIREDEMGITWSVGEDNFKRIVAFNLASIGSKYPEAVKSCIPIMEKYIRVHSSNKHVEYIDETLDVKKQQSETMFADLIKESYTEAIHTIKTTQGLPFKYYKSTREKVLGK